MLSLRNSLTVSSFLAARSIESLRRPGPSFKQRKRFNISRVAFLAALFFTTSVALASDVASERPAGSSGEGSIAHAIEQDLSDSIRLGKPELKVIERDGHITLSGTVSCVMDRRRAGEIAKRTAGVKAIANQIVIDPTERTDDAILADIRTRLRANDSVERSAIEVEVTAGRVTLIGQTDSLAEKRIAELAAGGVAGVQAIDNQLTVRNISERSDEEMRAEIAALLVHSVHLDDASIDVTVEEADAKLSGNVGSLRQRDFAEQLAEVRGVQRVDLSGITIDPSQLDPSEREKRYATVSDSNISQAVNRSLRFDPIVFHSADAIKVKVEDSTVTLKGTVPRLVTKRKAERLASDVIGVRRVVNELDVQWPEDRPSDIEMIKYVQDAIRRSPYLERREVRVHCKSAHVSIFGIVESKLEKQVAGWLADNVPGVVHVNNRLAIEREWEPKPDEKIQSDLQRKLKFTLTTAAEELDVTVEEGVAIIRGTVDTWRQWQTVTDLALEAGARHPHNLIDVRYHPAHGAPQTYIGY